MKPVSLSIFVLLLTGCAATVHCPPVEGEARELHLLDHGDHASLVIQRGASDYVRYSYGDRRWYAEGETGLASGLAALFRDTPAVMTRRELDRPDGYRVRTDHHHRLSVAATRADSLLERLETMFRADPAAIWYSAEYQLEFAPHPEPYTLGNTSNPVVADWLREAGCTVTGTPTTSNWRIRAD